ncbi:MAG TPA: NrpR regulatory domain-containing protein [Syntrophales bacterium]|nr:NrpR regulatory domain-containing protein [Syntrophales bacterium]
MKKFFDSEKIERKIVLILQILKDSGHSVGARHIARRMQDSGIILSERAVRYHLRLMDEKGLTRLVGKREGRVITDKGVDEVSDAMVQDKVGLAISRIEILAYRTTFDPICGSGLLPVNISLFRKEQFKDAMKGMKPVFEAGMAVSDLVAVARESEQLGNVTVPAGKVGLATVCSIVINGVLLKAGIPMDSKFAGILQLKDKKPIRFVELIYYSGSSLDPSETFIMAKMTSVRSVLKEGEGKILANFREIPALCINLVKELVAKLSKARIGGIFCIGEISKQVCEVHVDLNKVGLILKGGLNPIACAQEMGIQTENRGMATVMNFQDLRKFSEIYKGV